MIRLTVQHKYCGYTKKVEGETMMKAFKNNGLDLEIWIVIEIEEI